MSLTFADSIRMLRVAYVSCSTARSFYQINNGLCEDFAIDLIEVCGGPTDTLFELDGANFKLPSPLDGNPEGGWDWEMLDSYWNISAPSGFTPDQIDDISFGNHIWVTRDKRHYDAECPDGVDSFFDLPLFRRYLVADLRQRGIRADDVLTDDVLPAPLCLVPNPN